MNRIRHLRLSLASAFALSTSACGGAEQALPLPEQDPLVAQALSDQLMADPDLVGQNLAGSAITIETDYSLPTYDPSSASIRQARSEAAILAGGGQKLVVPELTGLDEVARKTPPRSLGKILSSMAAGTDCAASLRYSAVWAARMPELLPVYPHSATQIAAGNDNAGCTARAVTFHSAATVDELAAFYAALAKQGGFVPTYRSNGAERMLSGKRNNTQFEVVLRELSGGLTEVDLVTSGF